GSSALSLVAGLSAADARHEHQQRAAHDGRQVPFGYPTHGFPPSLAGQQRPSGAAAPEQANRISLSPHGQWLMRGTFAVLRSAYSPRNRTSVSQPRWVTARGSSPRSTSGSRWSPRRGASPARPGTTPPARAPS